MKKEFLLNNIIWISIRGGRGCKNILSFVVFLPSFFKTIQNLLPRSGAVEEHAVLGLHVYEMNNNVLRDLPVWMGVF